MSFMRRGLRPPRTPPASIQSAPAKPGRSASTGLRPPAHHPACAGISALDKRDETIVSFSIVSQQQLLLLLVSVPPTPSSLRVRVWRRLRSLGAVPLKRSAYLLPDTPDRYEDFQWLAQEIQRDGGEATLVRVQQIENVSPAEVLRLFHEPRDHDYRQLAARYRKVLQRLDKKSISPRMQEELARLAKDHQRIRDIDFFDAPGG